MNREVAIIGDRFMRPSAFIAALNDLCGPAVSCRSMELAWPDEPMEHGYKEAGFEGLKEYMGTPCDVMAHIGKAPVLITHLAPLSASMLASMPQLELVVVTRGGPVNIDLAAARAHDVKVVNTPGRNASAVAEFTIGAILSETRNITRGHEALRKGEYRGDLYRSDQVGDELSELTVGVIGYGEVGARVVHYLKMFGCRILVHDPYVHLAPPDLADGVTMAPFENLLSQSDIVTLHPRVTRETRGMINKEALAKMKVGATLINTARGPLMDYDALYEALAGGHLRGAMLETFAVEPPPPDWPLLRLPNVTLTPHIAGATSKTVRFAAHQAAEEVRRWLVGQPPINPC